MGTRCAVLRNLVCFLCASNHASLSRLYLGSFGTSPTTRLPATWVDQPRQMLAYTYTSQP